ncbi:MAG TPA: hypothetical protein VGI03_02210 [Verrucomicrobiae bacterium]|jgi:type II secretory pathway pseudopilin PulG
MKKIILFLPACLLLAFNVMAGANPNMPGALTFQRVSYAGTLSDDEARFVVTIDAEATGESSAPLLQGEVALLPAKLPGALRIIRDSNGYSLVADRAGRFNFQLEVVAKIQHHDPWKRISFSGPEATIASVTAQAADTNTIVRLLKGTLLEWVRTNGISRVTGFLDADRTVALRWQSQTAEIIHQVLFTVDSTITAQVTPTVIKYASKFHYEVVQGSTSELTFALPAGQTLTSLDGQQIRDWHLAADGDPQTLTATFLKPISDSYDLSINSEQAVTGANSPLNPPEPLKADRESGLLTVSAEDEQVVISAPPNLRQVDAPGDAIAAYQFDARPLALALALKPIEPVITAADRVSARLEESRLVVSHAITLEVEKSGIYTLELAPQDGFAVADVRGDGVEDWNIVNGRIQVDFSKRVLGSRQLTVQLEQALKTFPSQIDIAPLPVTGAEKETAQVGVASAAGIQLRTGTLSGAREIPVNHLADRSEEILAYSADQPGWRLSIASEKLAARIVADVFNLVTIGDGIVGGSATIRYGIVNQGVQEFKVRVPAAFKNVDFTGANIRSKNQSGDVWTIDLQDKAWGGYTLVVTYDFQFDAGGGNLPVGGIHAVDVERETGSLAVTTAASLQLTPRAAGDTLRRIDETELSSADRSFITRPVVLAYQYTGDQYDLAMDVQRFGEQPVLEAIADRTQITSVLTGDGEMLTQASFMVKNNEKQFQRFQLPENSKLWSCYVNNQPVKPESDGDWVLVPLPRDADRDQAFAVDIMYAQTNGTIASIFGKRLELSAPRTDVPNTYAEWQLFVPPGFRLSHFGGSMSVAEGTTYELFDAWEKFLSFYGAVLREAGGAILFMGFLAFLVIALVISAAKRGWSGVITLFTVMAILAVLGAMLLPALASAKRKAQRINSVNSLKEIGLAAKIFSGDHNDRLPVSFAEMKDELGTDKILYDTETGQPFTYVGGGMSLDDLRPDSVLAYSPIVNGHCEVLYADGSVAQISDAEFAAISQRGLVQLAAPQELAERQREMIAQGQMEKSADQASSAHRFGGLGGFAGGGGAAGIPATIPPLAPQPAEAITGSTFASVNPSIPAAPLPTASGIRSIRIELPQTGQPFLFTKVLNISDEPLSIRAHVMPFRTFQAMQMTWQSIAFLFGLVLWWRQWRRTDRSSLILTIALVLVFGSVCSLLVEHRALHDALIVGFPVVTLAIISWAIWKYWPRGRKIEEPELPPTLEPPQAGIAPVAAAIILLLALGLNGASAADSSQPDNQINGASIISADYSGTVNNRVAVLNATLQFSSAHVGQRVPAFGNDVAVEQFTVKEGKAELVRNGDGLMVQLDSHTATVEIKMLVKVTGDVTNRQLNFAVPPALSSQAEFTLDERGAEIALPSAISFRRVLTSDQTHIEAVLGPAGQVDLSWTPRMQNAGEIAATVFCQNYALAAFSGNILDIYSTLDYQVAQGELRQARLSLPAGQKLLRVDGSGIRSWQIQNENGKQIVLIDLLKGVTSSWRLTVETEKILGTLPASESIAIPHVLEVQRESGLVAMRSNDELELAVESASGLQRVDATGFTQAVSGAGDLSSVFQFLKPEFNLQVRAQAIQPEIEAVTRNYFTVSNDGVSLSAAIDFTIKHAGIFTLETALPDGYRVNEVQGDNIQQWTVNDRAGAHLLEIVLKDRASGAYTLNVQLTRDLKEMPKTLAFEGVQPTGVAKLMGFVAVSAAPGVAVNTESTDGLTEIPAASLPEYAPSAGMGAVLAYKFISSGPASGSQWNLSVSTESVAAWVRAEIVDSFTLADTLISGRAVVRYDIANAPVKELLVQVPDDFRDVEITGANIRSREQEGNIWHVELQNPALGAYTLKVTWDQTLSDKTNHMELAGVSAVNVERETGLLAVSARAPLQVDESAITDLQRVDISDFPDWAGPVDSSAMLAYRYIHPGYRLALNVHHLEEAGVLQAMIENAQFTSVVAEDGQMMTEMSLALVSNGRQFLEINMPPGISSSGVWSAFVADQPVRPSWRDGKLLLPIQQSAGDGGSLSVQLTYVSTNLFPGTRGQVGFASPEFDVPLKNARWEIYLPPDYDYKNFSGTMAREIAAGAEPGTSNFSILEYSSMEQANRSTAQTEEQQDISKAQNQLAAGDVRGANESFARAKAQVYAQKDGLGLDQLQQSVQTAAASNLIQAQSDFTMLNSGSRDAGGENISSQPSPPEMLYDHATAGEQWTKLLQAQEINSTTIQPLHVNLPVRGQHFAFTQVLQTETDRPLEIHFFATNTKIINWPLRIVATVAVFLALWGMMAIVSRIALRRAAPAV